MTRRLVLLAGATGAALVVGAVLVARAVDEDVTRRATIGPTTIVMLGDSITEEGDWDRLLSDREVSNQGYSGYTTAQLVPVAGTVSAERPAVVFVLTGTNDVRDGRPPSWTARHLNRILDVFEERSPDTVVVLQTVLPRADAPAEVAATNVAIAALGETRGVRVLDLHPVFDDGQGGLGADLTTDGIHLAEPGYQLWAGELRAHLTTDELTERSGDQQVEE